MIVKIFRRKSPILAAVAFAIFPRLSDAQAADSIFTNGNIYTLNEGQPRAEAIAVSGGRIVFVGANEDALKLRQPATRVVDFLGATVVPGMTDSHCHIFGVGQREMTLNLEGTGSLKEFLDKLKERIKAAEAGKWITGRGWIETFWKPQTFPTRHDLDTISPHNPVFLTRADGHGAVANSAALRLAGITKETANPFGGEILREKKTGEPAGMLLDHAQNLVQRHVPQPTPSELEEALLRGAQRSLQLGWCEIQNAGSIRAEVDLIRKLYGEGKVKLRIYNAVYGPGEAAERLLKTEPILNAFDHRFTTRTIKVVFDGSLGSRSAALLEPYSDAPDTSGFLTQKEAELRPMFCEALRRGIQIETHAIGDRANRLILDLYEEAFHAVPPNERKVSDPRWRVEHAQNLTAQDLPRFAQLGVIASMQPSHAIGDLFFAPARLGPKRLEGAYSWKSLLKTGALIAGGSDAPVERGEPMIEFYAAVSRKSMGGEQREGWHPEQAVSREQALKMFTVWPAYAAFEEHDKGSIEPGKLADLTVLSDDIMKIDEPQILKTRCLMTVIGGEVVFGRSD